MRQSRGLSVRGVVAQGCQDYVLHLVPNGKRAQTRSCNPNRVIRGVTNALAEVTSRRTRNRPGSAIGNANDCEATWPDVLCPRIQHDFAFGSGGRHIDLVQARPWRVRDVVLRTLTVGL